MTCCTRRQAIRTGLQSGLGLFVGGSFSYVGATTSEVNATMSASVILAKVAALRPRDFLVWRGGVYPFALDNIIPAGTSWGSAVTLRAYPGERPVIRPPSGSNRVLNMTRDGISYVILDGFAFDGTNVLYGLADIFGHHIRVMNSDLFGNNGPISSGQGNQSGIYMQRLSSTLPGSFCEFINVKIHDGGSRYAWNNGIYCEGEGNLFDNVEVYRYGGAGIQLFNSHGTTVHRNIVRNPIIHDLPMDTTDGRAQGVVIAHGDGNQVLGGQFWNIGTGNPAQRCCGAIQVDYGASNTLISGPNLRDCKVPAIFLGPGASKTIVKCATYTNNYQNLVNQGTGTIVDNAGCGGSTAPPPPATNVEVSQTQPPIEQQTSGAQSGVAVPLLIAGVIGAALLLGD